jgi:putative transcriptional regulator
LTERGWLIKLRKDLGLTQQQAAKLIGISRSYYGEIEAGLKNPSGKMAKKIAETFGFDMARFFDS